MPFRTITLKEGGPDVRYYIQDGKVYLFQKDLRKALGLESSHSPRQLPNHAVIEIPHKDPKCKVNMIGLSVEGSLRYVWQSKSVPAKIADAIYEKLVDLEKQTRETSILRGAKMARLAEEYKGLRVMSEAYCTSPEEAKNMANEKMKQLSGFDIEAFFGGKES